MEMLFDAPKPIGLAMEPQMPESVEAEDAGLSFVDALYAEFAQPSDVAEPQEEPNLRVDEGFQVAPQSEYVPTLIELHEQVLQNASLYLDVVGGFGKLFSLLGHGGALCAHCVASVGSAAGSLSGLASNAASFAGGLHIPSGGHMHSDGSIHYAGHSPFVPNTIPRTSGQLGRSLASKPSGISSHGSEASLLSWLRGPQQMLNGLGEFFSFRGETMDLDSFLASVVSSILQLAGTAQRA